MATLDNLPLLDPPLSSWKPVAGCPDKGPGWIDGETVARLGQQMANGTTVFATSATHLGELVAATPEEHLASLFATHLTASPLSSPFPLHHRVYALAASMRSLIDADMEGVTPAGGPIPPTLAELEIASSQLEAWLANAIGSFDLESVPEEHRAWLMSEVAMLDAVALSDLTGFKQPTLATWRRTHVGPPFVKLPGERRSIKYPVVGVLAWIYGMVTK